MKAAIYIVVSGEVLARWDDPTVNLPADLPVPPVGCAYQPISDQEFDDLAVTFYATGRLRWRWNGASFEDNPRSGQRPFFALCDSASRAVRQLDRDLPSFLPPGIEAVEVSKDDFGLISEAMLTDGIVPAWDCAADGTVTPRVDARPILVVSHAGDAVVGIPYSVDFQVTDSQGSPLPVNGGRNLNVLHDGARRLLRITVTNGQKNETPTFQESGRYEIVPEDPTLFRMGGNPVIEVAEQW